MNSRAVVNAQRDTHSLLTDLITAVKEQTAIIAELLDAVRKQSALLAVLPTPSSGRAKPSA